jgi:SAM-dependent methyltransferase
MLQSLQNAIRRVRRMDRETLGAYDAGAAEFAKDWHAQPAPTDLHALIRRFFHPGGRTADVGCGSGREVAFLAAAGFDAIGYDASDALLEQARLRYPRLSFATGVLPVLAGVPDAAFDNVLCETVIMHSLPELARHQWRRPARSSRPALLRLREFADPRGPRRRRGLAAR